MCIDFGGSTSGGWRTRYSKNGERYQTWAEPVPYIHPDYLQCTVYLYPSEAAAESGEQAGGTGFLVTYPAEVGGRNRILAVVTNRHVVDGGHMIARVNTDTGIDTVALDDAKWYHHPDGDDLSVCPIKISKSHRVKALQTHTFLREKLIDAWDIGPGDDVFVVGRFVNHEGKQKNIPSLRFGNVAQMPGEPIMIDGYPQQSFLVECRSISGYSGSPVFLWLENPGLPGLTKEGREMLIAGTLSVPGVSSKRLRSAGNGWPIGLWLLGINYGYLRSKEPVRNGAGSAMHDWYINSNTGMMGVIPAWRLMDIIDGDEMKPLKEQVAAADQKAKSDSAVVRTAKVELGKGDGRDERATERIRDKALRKALSTRKT